MNGTERLRELKERLYKLSKDAQAGKLDQKTSAEQIIELREEIEKVSKELEIQRKSRPNIT
jgi:hypothetical protein